MDFVSVGTLNGKRIFVGGIAVATGDFCQARLPLTDFLGWLLICNDWSGFSRERLSKLFSYLIANGSVFLGMWGRGSEVAHDLADELLLLDNQKAQLVPIPTSWEDEASLTEEIWHFVFSYTVDQQFVTNCSWIVASIDNAYTNQQLISMLKAAA